jgi:glycine/D-amino acid oxidase-like deaminating enzyme
MDVVIIGAGVVGVSVAAGLARRGATVTLVERDVPGAGTSSTSYAWVNANGKEPRAYYDLNRAGMHAHRELAAGGAEWLRVNGHVEFAVDDVHRRDLRSRMERLAGRGYPVEEITPGRARELLPDVNVPAEADTIAYFTAEAHCFPLVYLAHMLRRARTAGVRLRTHATVTALRETTTGADVTLADGTVLNADTVVSCTGRWTAELAALAGVEVPVLPFRTPGDVTVGYLAETDPVPVELDRLVTSPWLNVRPAGGGRLQLQALDLDRTAEPGRTPPEGVADGLLTRARALIPNTESAVVSRLMVGQRAMPADGRSIIGRPSGVPWLYVVATHSGVTLAPLLGERVPAEVFGAEEEMFADFRPARFAGATEITPPRTPRKPGQQ